MTTHDPRLNSPAWRRLRLLILDRDRWLCQIKGRRCLRYATAVDHVIARADGGDCWSPANLRAACRACNSSGGAALTNARRHATTVANYVTRL
jgi:5-methylcytosine-specific restriction endonuclease McrA